MKTLTLQDIPRIKAGTTTATGTKSLDEVDQERLYLATRAQDVLGYGLLRQQVTGERKVGVCEGKLTETMLKLDLPILDTATVIEYQLEEMTRRNREFISTHLNDWAGSGWQTTPARWSKTKLDAYEMPIPEFVLDKAIKIKEALPGVNFYIQHLDDPKADPFLVACHDKEVYYVEAWDESRFERAL
jgi:hypothetical protein